MMDNKKPPRTNGRAFAVNVVADANSSIEDRRTLSSEGAGGAAFSNIVKTCLLYCPDPDIVQRIGEIFLRTAAEMRAIGMRETGNA